MTRRKRRKRMRRNRRIRGRRAGGGGGKWQLIFVGSCYALAIPSSQQTYRFVSLKKKLSNMLVLTVTPR